MLFVARHAIFLCLPIFLVAVLSAQSVTISQPTIWANKPDVAAFEKIENDRLAAGQRSIDNSPGRQRRAHHREHARALRRSRPSKQLRRIFRRTHGAGSSRRHLSRSRYRHGHQSQRRPDGHRPESRCLQRSCRARCFQRRRRHPLLRSAPAS